MARVLIVDDEKSIRSTLRDILEFEQYDVDEAVDGLDAIAQLKKQSYDVIIMDIKMPKMDGLEALERVAILAPDTPVVMISGHGNIETAVEAVKKGAYDYISKPPDLNRMLITLRNAMDKSSLITETKVLKRRVSKARVQAIIGESEPITRIKSIIDQVAPTDARVMITGPNGTGKELVARWLHEKSNRQDKPMVEVNCAAIPSELIESELFGHEKGAFTSAVKQRIGKFEQANGGTIFLDEIGDMSLSAQAKVLRALQENKITRVGGDKEISVDVRVIAATNKNLLEEIRAKRFREDLYHRIAVIVVNVPALNERKEDIPSLVQHFVKTICKEYGQPTKAVDEAAIQALQSLDWTGNIRELRNVVERLIILSRDRITAQDVELFVRPSSFAANEFAGLFEKFDNLQDLQDYIADQYQAYHEASA